MGTKRIRPVFRVLGIFVVAAMLVAGVSVIRDELVLSGSLSLNQDVAWAMALFVAASILAYFCIRGRAQFF